jgi:hypothetical protein
MSPYSVRSSSNSQVLPGCCHHDLKLRGSVLDLWLFHIGWDHQCDLLTVCPGASFCELLVAMGSVQDPHRYLPAVLDQGPCYIESFRSMGLQMEFYQVIFYSKGALQSSHHHSHSIVQVSPHPWPPGCKAEAPPPSSIVIPLPLQDAAFGALGPQIHCMCAGCPAPG